MLKTLKWIYQLGKTQEERRLYHALREQARARTQNNFYSGLLDEKEYEKRKLKDQEIEYALNEIIHKVFQPIEDVQVELKPRNRFDEVDI